MKSDAKVNLTVLPITEFGPKNTVYARKARRDHSYTFFGKFVKFERGCVTLRGHLIEPDWGDARDFGAEHWKGIVKITVRLKNCFLWGRTEDDGWPRCHWFKSSTKRVE